MATPSITARTVSVRSGCSCDEALRVARLEAERAYGDLSEYRVTVVLESDGWHVDYELKDCTLDGGGPHYVIDLNGQVRLKRYEQ